MRARNCVLWLAGLCWVGSLPAQDPAVEDRLTRIEGQIRDLLAAQAEMQKRMAGLVRELSELRDQVRSGTGDYATQADLRRLADAVQEVDRKRREDYEKIAQEIQQLAKVLSSANPPARTSAPATEERTNRRRSTSPDAGGPVEKGYEYVVKPGDTLHAIVQAYREQGVNVTVAQVLKANPGLNPNRLQVGQKIFIPLPAE
jgi:LysM repeat protein